MFLVEMAYNTIKEEITELQIKTDRKTHALQESDATLEKDNGKLVKFIEDDNKTTKDRGNAADEATTKRKGMEGKIKTLESKIQYVNSEIDKNKDQLNALEEHKEFLQSIFEKEKATDLVKIKEKRENRHAEIKRDWIKEMKLNRNIVDELLGE